jgi:ketosteroid isomerase-like protein
MSREDVELVRDVLARFRETRQPVVEFLAPDFVWDVRSFPGWTGKAGFHGADGLSEFMDEWTAAYSDWTYDVEDLIDADEGRVVATLLQRGRLKGSDAWVDLRVGFLYTLKDGLLRRVEAYASREPRSRRAAGVARARFARRSQSLENRLQQGRPVPALRGGTAYLAISSARPHRARSEDARRSGSTRWGGSKWWRLSKSSSVKSLKTSERRSAIRS